MAPVDVSLEGSTDASALRLALPPSADVPIEPLVQSQRPSPAAPIPMPVPRQALMAGITFDALGLPEQYFVSPKLKGIVWAKLVGRVLSLQSLLMSSLQLGSFSYAKTTCEAYVTIVVAQDCRHIALLFDPRAISKVTTSALCQWMRQLDEASIQRLWEKP
jgi:hypothetical protein